MIECNDNVLMAVVHARDNEIRKDEQEKAALEYDNHYRRGARDGHAFGIKGLPLPESMLLGIDPIHADSDAESASSVRKPRPARPKTSRAPTTTIETSSEIPSKPRKTSNPPKTQRQKLGSLKSDDHRHAVETPKNPVTAFVFRALLEYSTFGGTHLEIMDARRHGIESRFSSKNVTDALRYYEGVLFARTSLIDDDGYRDVWWLLHIGKTAAIRKSLLEARHAAPAPEKASRRRAA